MEQRTLFKKRKQRNFLNLVIKKLNCVSLKGLLQYGFNVKYCSLKNYYNERRLIPKSFFENLCYLAKISASNLNVKFIDGNWGQGKGGKKGIRATMKKYPKKIKEEKSLYKKRFGD